MLELAGCRRQKGLRYVVWPCHLDVGCTLHDLIESLKHPELFNHVDPNTYQWLEATKRQLRILEPDLILPSPLSGGVLAFQPEPPPSTFHLLTSYLVSSSQFLGFIRSLQKELPPVSVLYPAGDLPARITQKITRAKEVNVSLTHMNLDPEHVYFFFEGRCSGEICERIKEIIHHFGLSCRLRDEAVLWSNDANLPRQDLTTFELDSTGEELGKFLSVLVYTSSWLANSRKVSLQSAGLVAALSQELNTRDYWRDIPLNPKKKKS